MGGGLLAPQADRAGLARSPQLHSADVHGQAGCRVCGAGGARRLATPQAAALAFAAVPGECSSACVCGSAAESQVIGLAPAGPRAEEVAEWYVTEDRCPWRRPNWLEWDSARPVHPRSMCAVTPSRYGWCRSVPMSFPAARWNPHRSSRGTTVPHTGRCRAMFVTVGTGGSAARGARPVSTGVGLRGDGTAVAGVRRKSACGG